MNESLWACGPSLKQLGPLREVSHARLILLSLRIVEFIASSVLLPIPHRAAHLPVARSLRWRPSELPGTLFREAPTSINTLNPRSRLDWVYGKVADFLHDHVCSIVSELKTIQKVGL